MLLDINDLHVAVEGKEILNGINLNIKPGEIHALMGPNGAGKSTLAKVLGGDPLFTITKGTIRFQGKEMQEMPPEERVHLGLFLSFQDPIEIAGLTTSDFLFAIYKARGKEGSFEEVLKEKMHLVGVDEEWLERGLNEGFSGGEKKKSELLQLALLEPTCAILDEMDSGLDIDALKSVTKTLKELHSPLQAYLLITHYHRLLKQIKPDFVHILMGGKIIKTGSAELACDLEEKGYDGLTC